ncbi:flagellar M-ring protein FliF [Candidatus Poribacteria bacterium]|nr:flagellar M-ring protein FliF [Candidatus Poribacteria bacterium]
MREVINSLRSSFGDSWGNLSVKRKLIIGLAAAAVVAGLISVALWSSRPDYAVLFSGLSPEDTQVIQDELYAARVPHRESPDGSSIMVPASEVHRMRMRLANKGLPEIGAVGFESFDKTDFGMTDFVQKLKYQRALQIELSRTISRLREVTAARVHIALPRESVFTEREQPCKASVVLNLRPGARLEKSQVNGIVHLVASAVQGLQKDKVTVLDTSGRMLSSPDNSSYVDSSQLEYQKEMESSLEKQVQNMLDLVLGYNKAAVQVAAEIDFTSGETTSETYEPESVIRSETSTKYTSKGANPSVSIGVPSVTANVNPNPQTTGITPEYDKTDTSTEYEIGRTILKTIQRPGTIKKLSVAVVVDNKTVDGNSVPRTQQELQDIESLVRNAVGVDNARGDPQIEIRNIPFDTSLQKEMEEAEKLLKREKLRDTIVKAAIAVIAGVLLLIVLRSLLKNRGSEDIPAITEGETETPELDQGEEVIESVGTEQLPELSAQASSEIAEASGPLERDKRRIIAMVDSDPDKVIQIIREWVSE